MGGDELEPQMLEPYDVRRLPEAGETISDSLDAQWLEAIAVELGPDALGLAPTGDGEVSIQLRAIAGASTDLPAVRVTGHAKGPFRIDCVRCLTPLSRELEAELDLSLFPEAPIEETPRDRSTPSEKKTVEKKGKGRVEKIELSARELDEGSYRGFELDLPSLVREALLLEVEMNPACTDETACEARVQALAGASGNPEGKGAPAEGEETPGGEIDPRWAPLQKFRLKSS